MGFVSRVVSEDNFHSQLSYQGFKVAKKKDPKDLKKPGPKPRPIDLQVAYEKAKEGAEMIDIQKALGRAPNQSNFSNLQKNNPELKQAIKQGREENIQAHVKQIIPMAQWALKEILSNPDHPGFTAATLFIHKTQMGFRETNKVEVSGEVQHIHSLSPEDRAKRIQQLRQELEAQVVDVAIEAEEKSDDPS